MERAGVLGLTCRTFVAVVMIELHAAPSSRPQAMSCPSCIQADHRTPKQIQDFHDNTKKLVKMLCGMEQLDKTENQRIKPLGANHEPKKHWPTPPPEEFESAPVKSEGKKKTPVAIPTGKKTTAPVKSEEKKEAPATSTGKKFCTLKADTLTISYETQKVCNEVTCTRFQLNEQIVQKINPVHDEGSFLCSCHLQEKMILRFPSRPDTCKADDCWEHYAKMLGHGLQMTKLAPAVHKVIRMLYPLATRWRQNHSACLMTQLCEKSEHKMFGLKSYNI